MYIALDMQQLVFRYKHSEKQVLNALINIELAHSPIRVYALIPDSQFPDLTDLDLRLIYKHHTGTPFEGYSRTALIEAVGSIAKFLPEADATWYELILQSNSITDKGFYKYIKGACEPLQLPERYSPEIATVAPSQISSGPALNARITQQNTQGVPQVAPAPKMQTPAVSPSWLSNWKKT